MPHGAPTTLVILGATGDLMRKKIVPALFHLHQNNKLPEPFYILGFARRPFTDQSFRELVTSMLEERGELQRGRDALPNFLQRLSYAQGQFDDPVGYRALASRLPQNSNKLFYMAVAPHFVQSALRHLATTGLLHRTHGATHGWSRVLVEKPFGVDQKTATALERQISAVCAEEYIYRIDHYLAKEMMQNIFTFRFRNNLFEPVWNNQYIERIDIQLLETIGIEHRGAFYDSLGALRDVGQNHHLQMLAFVTMERPECFETGAIRRARADILNTLVPLAPAQIKSQTVRAQYDGYLAIPGIDPHSQTETYFKFLTHLSHPRWLGVPIILESGKRIAQDRTEIIVTLKDQNKILFTMEPFEGITIQFVAKKPGHPSELEERAFDFLLRTPTVASQYVEEYERLLLDSISGDQTLFLSTEEILAMWKHIDPVLSAWQADAVPLLHYTPDTDEARGFEFGSRSPIINPSV